MCAQQQTPDWQTAYGWVDVPHKSNLIKTTQQFAQVEGSEPLTCANVRHKRSTLTLQPCHTRSADPVARQAGIFPAMVEEAAAEWQGLLWVYPLHSDWLAHHLPQVKV